MEKLKNILKNGYKAFLLSWEGSKGYTIVAIAIELIGGILPVVQVWLSKLIVDSVIEIVKSAWGGGPVDLHRLALVLSIQISLWVFQEILGSASMAVRTILGDKVYFIVSYRLMDKVSSLDISYYDDPEFYNRLREASDGVRNEPIEVIRRTLAIIRQGITAISMGIVLIRLHWLVPFILAAVTIPHTIAFAKYIARSFSLFIGWSTPLRKIRYLNYVVPTSREHAKEVRLFGLKDYLLGHYSKIWNEYFDENRRIYFSYGKASAASGVLSSVVSGLTFAYAAIRTAQGAFTIGDLMMFQGAIDRFQDNITNILTNLTNYYGSYLYLDRFFSFLSLKPKLRVLSDPPRAVPSRLKKGIEFRDVSFKYPGSDRFALKGVNLSIKPGESIALVGENGAGKTTLVKLLVRLYDPTEGVILIDGNDIREYDLNELYRLFGVIFQDFVKYPLSVRENIGFGDVERIWDDDRIRDAAEKAGVLDLIERLPKGYETILGLLFDEGVDLSVGEWQKIALARAFFRDAEVLILDEPTASLDAYGEYEIYRKFHELTWDKTTVLISHRFSTVRMVDRIYVVDNGRIIEEGSHDELIALGGKYAEMFNLQAQRYI